MSATDCKRKDTNAHFTETNANYKQAIKMAKLDIVTQIMAWEGGEMSDDATIDFFAELVANGMAWTLQGCYGRTAVALIDAGYISRQGKVLKYTGE
jgi:hypothetical protein